MYPSGGIDKEPEKILVNVKLDEENTDSLVIFPGDSAETLARAFAAKHGLGEELEKRLEKLIAESQHPAGLPPRPGPVKKPSQNIHNRLYMDSKYTRRHQRDSPIVLVKEKQSSHANYGDYLYKQAKSTENTKWKANISIKISLQQATEKELTFHPLLPHSQSTSHISQTDFFNRSKVITRSPPITNVMQECSFKPKINSHVKSTGNIHEKLYLQGTIRQKIANRPEMRKNSSKNDSQERKICITRLLNSHLVTEAKIKKIQRKNESAGDTETNQAFFHPKVGREPYVALEKPVWERLYSNSIETVSDPEDIYKAFRKVQYQKIFNVLDSDSDGKISKNSINFSDFDEKTLALIGKILTPLLLENGITFEKFSEVFETNVTYFSMEDRMWLFRRDICR